MKSSRRLVGLEGEDVVTQRRVCPLMISITKAKFVCSRLTYPSLEKGVWLSVRTKRANLRTSHAAAVGSSEDFRLRRCNDIFSNMLERLQATYP